jgi:hypothetical protein
MTAILPQTPQQFYDEFFASRAARNGEVIRRKATDVDRFVGKDAFLAEMKRRGYRVYHNAGQFVVFCNREPVQRLA